MGLRSHGIYAEPDLTIVAPKRDVSHIQEELATSDVVYIECDEKPQSADETIKGLVNLYAGTHPPETNPAEYAMIIGGDPDLIPAFLVLKELGLKILHVTIKDCTNGDVVSLTHICWEWIPLFTRIKLFGVLDGDYKQLGLTLKQKRRKRKNRKGGKNAGKKRKSNAEGRGKNKSQKAPWKGNAKNTVGTTKTQKPTSLAAAEKGNNKNLKDPWKGNAKK